MGTVLKLDHISRQYPGVLALDDVSVSFEAGEIHAIMGENGAGKSTLIKIISGAVAPSKGVITTEKASYRQMTPVLARQEGIAVVYQELTLISGLSIAENIFLGDKLGGRLFQNFSEMYRRTDELFSKFHMKVDPKASIDRLSNSDRQITEIIKAVSKNPKILILDEPSSALAEAEVGVMLGMVKQLAKDGVCVLYITHRMDEVFEIADRVTVLRDGKYIDTRPIGDLDRGKLITMMVGRELTEDWPIAEPDDSENVLEVEDLSGNGVSGVCFKLKKGEILGIGGLVGSGRTEMAKVLYGAARMDHGSIRCHGQQVSIRSTSDAIRNRIGLIPEDRKEEGVFLDFPVRWNIAVDALPAISKASFVNRKAEKQQSDEFIEKLSIKTPSDKRLVKTLSGGNQQKVSLAKTLATRSDILIFDEPTRGIDVGAKQEIYSLMHDLTQQGISIIMISSETDELIGMSNRIIVMYEGKMAGELQRDEFSQENILSLASGLGIPDRRHQEQAI